MYNDNSPEFEGMDFESDSNTLVVYDDNVKVSREQLENYLVGKTRFLVVPSNVGNLAFSNPAVTLEDAYKHFGVPKHVFQGSKVHEHSDKSREER